MLYHIDNFGTFEIRQFRPRDNFIVAAELIHGTDSHIYNFWQSDMKKFQDEITRLMKREGFIFNYQNLYGAFYKTSFGLETPYSILLLLDAYTSLGFDYSSLKQLDDHHDFVITNYVEKLIEQRRTMPEDALLGVCLCTTPKHRNRGLGGNLIKTVLQEKALEGYTKLYFDCLQDNPTALKVYQQMGCKILGSGIGFDGTNQSTVKIYHMSMEI